MCRQTNMQYRKCQGKKNTQKIIPYVIEQNHLRKASGKLNQGVVLRRWSKVWWTGCHPPISEEHFWKRMVAGKRWFNRLRSKSTKKKIDEWWNEMHWSSKQIYVACALHEMMHSRKQSLWNVLQGLTPFPGHRNCGDFPKVRQGCMQKILGRVTRPRASHLA